MNIINRDWSGIFLGNTYTCSWEGNCLRSFPRSQALVEKTSPPPKSLGTRLGFKESRSTSHIEPV